MKTDEGKLVQMTEEQYERWSAHAKAMDELHRLREERRLAIYDDEITDLKKWRQVTHDNQSMQTESLERIAVALERMLRKMPGSDT